MKLRLSKDKRTIAFEVMMAIGVIIILFNIGKILIFDTDYGSKGSNTEVASTEYVLPQSPTDYQKTIYKELSEAVKSEPQGSLVTPALVVKNFVADYYTWTNKAGSYDVGGLNYVVNHSYLVLMESSRIGFYKDLDAFATKYGQKNLLEVTNVETNTLYAAPFGFLDSSYEAYYVEAKWTYAERDDFPIDQFQNKAVFIVIKYEDSLRVARFLKWE